MAGMAGNATANERYAAYVLDANTGKVLFSRNSDARRYPASLTKMMTVYLIFHINYRQTCPVYERKKLRLCRFQQKRIAEYYKSVNKLRFDQRQHGILHIRLIRISHEHIEHSRIRSLRKQLLLYII